MKFMKALIVVIALAVILLMAFQARSQSRPDTKQIVDAVVAQTKAKSLNSGLVKWDSIRNVMYQVAEGATTVAGMRRSFEILLFSIRDEDGFFFDPATKTPIAGPVKSGNPEVPSDEKPFSGPTEFFYKTLRHNIRYIRITALPEGGDIQSQAQAIRQAVDSLSKGDAAHWIVDLRYAVGGAVNPMMAGIAPLLEEGLAATSADSRENILSMYTVHNGNFYVDQVPVARFPISKTDLRNARIAVLTSRHTSGAAEMLAVALKGRKHTRFFGEPTRGDIFGMATIDLSKDLAMQIRNTMFMDRRGNAYKSVIEPDTFIALEPARHLEDEKAISEASMWLRTVVEPEIKVGMK